MARKRMSKKTAAPARRSCACVQAHMGLLDRYPEFRANQSRIQRDVFAHCPLIVSVSAACAVGNRFPHKLLVRLNI